MSGKSKTHVECSAPVASRPTSTPDAALIRMGRRIVDQIDRASELQAAASDLSRPHHRRIATIRNSSLHPDERRRLLGAEHKAFRESAQGRKHNVSLHAFNKADRLAYMTANRIIARKPVTPAGLAVHAIAETWLAWPGIGHPIEAGASLARFILTVCRVGRIKPPESMRRALRKTIRK